MKKYLSGSWEVIKNYIFGMIFFFIFIIGFYSWADIFSMAIFIIVIPIIYFELTHYAGVDKRRYGTIKPYEGAIYGLLAVVPFIIIQIIISQLNLNIPPVDFAVLKLNIVKGFVAPMLFIAKAGGYTIWSYALAWSTIVLAAFLGYFSGYKGFDLGAFIRKTLGLQPKKKTTNKRYRR